MTSRFHELQRTVELSPTLEPTHNNTPSAGYSIPLNMEINNKYSAKKGEIEELAGEILKDQMLQILLSDRIYALMCEDLTYYKERARSYGGRN